MLSSNTGACSETLHYKTGTTRFVSKGTHNCPWQWTQLIKNSRVHFLANMLVGDALLRRAAAQIRVA